MADTEKKPKAEKAPKDDKPAKAPKAEKPAAAAAGGDAPAAKGDAKPKGAAKAKGGDKGDKGGDKPAKGKPKAAPAGGPARMRGHYDQVVRKTMTEKFGYKNAMQVPGIDKIVLNMGIGEGVADRKKVESAAASSAFLRSLTASPIPMLSTTLSRRGTCNMLE